MGDPSLEHRLDATIDLSARTGLLVEHEGFQPEPGGGDGCGKTGGPGPDDGEIRLGAQTRTRALPGWREIRMPAATGIRHAC